MEYFEYESKFFCKFTTKKVSKQFKMYEKLIKIQEKIILK